MLPESGTIIEGIGDDLIYGLLLFGLGIMPLAGTLYFWQRRSRDQNIHPQSETAVQDVRERLRNRDDTPTGGGTEPSDSTQDTATPQPQPGNSRYSDRTCPVCLIDARYGIETNCGHLFCGECIVTYWSHGNWLGAVRCPVCRQQVTLLLPNFIDNENNTSTPEKDSIMQQIHRYNRRFSGQPIPWIDYIRDLPTILRHCVRDFFSLGGLIWMFRLRVIVCFFAALLYFISPLDIIPEAAFGFLGLLDDFFILLLLAIYVSIIYRRVVTERAEAN